MRIMLVLLLGITTISGWAAAEKEAASRVTPLFVSEAAMVAALKPLTAMRKDNFESSADFGKRLCPATEKALNATIGAPVNLAVFGVNGNYDADKHAFMFFLHAAATPGLFDRSLGKFLGITVAEVTRKKGTYQGRNAFGVSKDALAEEGEEAILLLPTNRAQPVFWSKTVQLPAKPDEARKLDKDLQLVITTKLQRPCFVTGANHRSPDMSFPFDMTSTLLGVFGSRDSSWKIIKKSTGEVLKTGGL